MYKRQYLAFGELIAFVIGWDLILEYALQAATVSAGWSGYFNKLLEGFGLHLPVELTAAYGTTPGVTTYFNLPGFVIVLIITWVLSIGINQTKKTNDIMVMIKLAIIVLFIVCTVWYINPANWKPFSPYGIYTFQPGSTQPYGIVPAASIVFFSFIGFDAVSSSAEETINPNKTLPRGILISLAVSTVLYIIMTLIMTGVVPYKEFAKFIDAPVAGVILETGLNWLAFIVNLGALIGMTTVMLVQLYGQSRICYAMSRDGLFPKFFGEVHPKYRTPFKGTWFFGILTAIAGGFININVLFELVNIGTLSAFIIVSAGDVYKRQIPSLGGISAAEPLAVGLAEIAAVQQLARGERLLGHQLGDEVFLRRLVGFEQACAFRTGVRGHVVGFVVMQFDMVFVGEQLHRVTEIDVLLMFDVAEHVAAETAAEAMPHAERGTYGKTWRFLVMEGA